MVVARGLNEDEIEDFALLTKRSSFHVRFLEYMPLDGYGDWDRTKVCFGRRDCSAAAGAWEPRGDSIERSIRSRAPLPIPGCAGRGQSDLAGYQAVLRRVQPYFAYTAGSIKNCLFGQEEWNVRDLLRSGAGDDQVRALIRLAVARKKPPLADLILIANGPPVACRKSEASRSVRRLARYNA